MLKNLYIKNFIIFDEINLDFHDGFSAFTGETGAGKSIMVDAISLLCASRASSSFISSGKDFALIEGVFDFSNSLNVKNILSELGFEDLDNTIISREIKSDGKSVTRINRRIVNLSLVKEIMDLTIDIHSQHDTQYLLKSSNHIHLLDSYIDDNTLLSEVSKNYYEYKNIKDEMDDELSNKYNEDDIEYFKFCIDEIDNANLIVGEDEQLIEKEKEYISLSKNFEKIANSISIYENIESELYDINKSLKFVNNDTIAEISEEINNAYYLFDEGMDKIKSFINSLDLDEENINQIQKRLFDINSLKRKYGSSIEDILQHKDELIEKLDIISNRQLYLDNMQKKVDIAYNKFLNSAKLLSEKRIKLASKLDKEIMSILKDLMLPNIKFKTNITENNFNNLGIDKVEFLISMNLGEELKSLSKVASGGELSRLMLGLKTIFSKLQGISTIIFDEIDTGVSGVVATSIGQKMKSLSNSCQVISITHLSQVAACSNHHYHVSKINENNKTKTIIKELDYDEKINELAMISSGDITELSIKAATELYKKNQGI